MTEVATPPTSCSRCNRCVAEGDDAAKKLRGCQTCDRTYCHRCFDAHVERELRVDPFDLPQPCWEPWGPTEVAACVMRAGHLGDHVCMRLIAVQTQYQFENYNLALE